MTKSTLLYVFIPAMGVFGGGVGVGRVVYAAIVRISSGGFTAIAVNRCHTS